MPQLDPSTFSSQLFWLFLTFFSLYLILHFWIMPKFKKVFDLREYSIDGKLDSARRLREEAERMMAEYEETIESAKNEARQRYLGVLQEVSQEINNKQKEMAASIAERVKEAEEELNKEKNKIKAELLPEAANVAQEILEKILGKKLDINDIKKYQRDI